MKKIKKLTKIFFTFLLILVTVFTSGNVNITTESKKVYSNNNGEVSDRELALLASLVYEDVPSRNVCKKKSSKEPIEGEKCYFTSNDIEGMSEGKMNGFAKITQANQEDGQIYYFNTFADTSEAKDWKIVNFQSKKVSKLGIEGSTSWEGRFSAITFKKGNNYVIAFRGTDYPDVLEWLQDFSYVKGDNDHSEWAFNYAKSEYDRIVADKKDSPAKIYVTGHSLGAYLAQVGGAGIISRGFNKNLDYSKNLTIDLKKQYDYSASKNLKKVVYFNGMGVSALNLITNDNTLKYKNAINALARVNADGTIANSKTKVNYNDNISSSGRLISYSMEGDPVSSIGFHYGEIRKLKPAADAVTYHRGNHFLPKLTNKFSNFVNRTKGAVATLFSGNDVVKYNSIINGEGVEKIVDKIKEAFKSLSKNGEERSNKFYKEYDELAKKLTLEANNTIDKISPFVQIKNDTEEEARYSYAGLSLSTALKGIEGKMSEYGDIWPIDIVNITHETDSFLCLIDDTNGVPNVVGQVAVAKNNGNDPTTTVQYDKGDKDNITRVYTSDKNTFSLIANVTGGCARSYTWHKTDANGTPIKEISSGKNNYNNYIVIPKGRGIKNNTREYYTVEVTYNNSYDEQKLRVDGKGAYSYVKGDTQNSGDKTIKLMYEVIYDMEAPTCSFDPSSINVKRGKTVNVVLNCTDNTSRVSTKITKKKYNNYYFSASPTTECNGSGTCIIAVTAKKRLFTIKSKITFTAEVKDRVGNGGKISSKLNVKVKR